ncbi:MAG: electron transport complex subunit RsxC [Gammaproteobacteria bacterium]|jgi:electron transport complex protein RnfC|nr:electron transport complex subunit RsxC [Gammaproteobacteria bacterium]
MPGPKHQSFRHGIHPPEHKEDTAHLAIKQFPFAPLLIIPFSQHIGREAVPVVKAHDEVIRGQLLAKADGFMSVPIHAPASGVIKNIGLVPSIQGTMVNGLYLESYPASTQEILEGNPCPLDAGKEEIIAAIQNAGIAGLGGAAFPTHVKLKIPEGTHVDTVLINGIECEPYLTTDHRVMLEQTGDIFTGIRYLLKATGAERAVIGVEANKPDAALMLKDNAPNDLAVSVEVLNIKYPQGAEKMLIKTLLNREVPTGAHSVEIGVIGINVATAAEIGRLLPHGRGIQERVITVGGNAVNHKGNYRVPIGTPLRFILDTVGVQGTLSEVFLGGPMMGQAAPGLDIPVTKGTSGVIAYSRDKNAPPQKIYPCIHCGRCVQACPMLLNPSQLGLLAKKNQYEKMADEFNLKDCFECGACSFVCPSHIPLVQYFRIAKSQLKKAQAA